jgi:hypothetical protein
MSAHLLKDWNHQLRLNAASCAGARQLYHHIGEVFGLCQPDFKSLPAAKMDALIVAYAELIERNRPDIPARPSYLEIAVGLTRSFASGLRPTHAPVIGAIQPGEKP